MLPANRGLLSAPEGSKALVNHAAGKEWFTATSPVGTVSTLQGNS